MRAQTAYQAGYRVAGVADPYSDQGGIEGHLSLVSY